MSRSRLSRTGQRKARENFQHLVTSCSHLKARTPVGTILGASYVSPEVATNEIAGIADSTSSTRKLSLRSLLPFCRPKEMPPESNISEAATGSSNKKRSAWGKKKVKLITKKMEAKSQGRPTRKHGHFGATKWVYDKDDRECYCKKER